MVQKREEERSRRKEEILSGMYMIYIPDWIPNQVCHHPGDLCLSSRRLKTFWMCVFLSLSKSRYAGATRELR